MNEWEDLWDYCSDKDVVGLYGCFPFGSWMKLEHGYIDGCGKEIEMIEDLGWVD